MNTGGEAADQVIRISLNGMEVAAKISGKAALEIANMLYAVMKDQKKTKGKTRLENLISTGKPLSVFTLKSSDLASFQKEAKKYGILYYAVRNQRSNFDGMVDIMVKTEDSSRINRIVERFKLSDVSQTAQVKTDIEKTRATKKQKAEQEIVRPNQITTNDSKGRTRTVITAKRGKQCKPQSGKDDKIPSVRAYLQSCRGGY